MTGEDKENNLKLLFDTPALQPSFLHLTQCVELFCVQSFLSRASSRSSPSPPPGDRVGRLRPTGPQVFHGCSTDPAGGPGPVQHGDWLVQTLPALLAGGPHLSAAHTAGVPDVSGKLRTTAGRSVLVSSARAGTTPPPPTTPPHPSPISPSSQLFKRNKGGVRRRARRQQDGGAEPRWSAGGRRRGRDRTSQSEFSWSLTIMSCTFTLPPPPAPLPPPTFPRRFSTSSLP